MKKGNIFFASLIIFCSFGFLQNIVHAQTIPNFPMAFWGNITVDGNPAPTGTIVRAYYGTSTLAGNITIQEAGIYGYNDPIKQQLVVGEGGGPITFTVQNDALNSGTETAGISAQTFSGFTSGDTENLNLIFTLPTPAQSQTSGGGSGGGTPPQVVSSGGGGGGGGYVAPIPAPAATTSTGEVLGASTTDPTALLTLLSSLLSEVKSLEKQLITQQIKTAQCSVTFSTNLSQGVSSSDVKNLQKTLNDSSLTQIAPSGPGSPGNESIYFGAATKKAVINFQDIFSDEILVPAGLIAGNGSVGPGTRAELNKLCSQ